MKKIEKQICDRSANLKKYIEYKCHGNKQLAEDLYSETMLKILTGVKIEKLKNNYSLDGYMGFCAKTVISCYFQTEATRKRLRNTNYVYCIATEEKSPEKNYETEAEIKGFMKKVDKKLGVTCKKIIMLLLYQNMNHEEIASTLDKDRGTISSHMLRMRRILGNIHLNKYREINA